MESAGLDQSKLDWRAVVVAQLAGKRGAQFEFARELGCSESHLSRVLKRGKKVSYELATRIAAKIGVPVEAIMAPPLVPRQDDEGNAS